MKTADPENDQSRTLYLPERLRAAGFNELAEAFEQIAARGDAALDADQQREWFALGDMHAVTQAALLIAGHMSGPSLRFGGRPPRPSDSERFNDLVTKARARVKNGEDRRAIVAALVVPLYANGRPGRGLPATAKALREKLNRALRETAR